jgi:prepilin peptidase CpaA
LYHCTHYGKLLASGVSIHQDSLAKCQGILTFQFGTRRLPMNLFLNLTPAAWQLWCFFSVALALVIALEADLLESRIPNVLVVGLFVVGLLLQTVGPANGREGVFGAYPGAIGAGRALLGAAIGLVIFLPVYLAGAMGAGDVKFMAALGVFAGPVDVVGAALSVAACGGLMALGLTLSQRKAAAVWGNVVRIADGLIRPVVPDRRFDPKTQTALRMPYALAFALGVTGYGYWRQSGHPAWISF